MLPSARVLIDSQSAKAMDKAEGLGIDGEKD